MRWKIVTLFALSLWIGVGCASTKKLPIYIDDSRRVIPVQPGDVLRRMKGDTILDFRGVIIPRGRFFYLLRCEGYVIESGVRP